MKVTVEEFIEELKKYEPKAIVNIPIDSGYYKKSSFSDNIKITIFEDSDIYIEGMPKYGDR